MATLNRAIKELRSERNRLETELERVDAALSALSSLNSRGRGRGADVQSPAGQFVRRGHVCCRTEEDGSSPESTVGEATEGTVEEGRVV